MTGGLPGLVHVSPDPEATAAGAAAWIRERAAARRSIPGSFSIALAGGSTPRLLYDRLAAQPGDAGLDWPAWEVYYGDERACPPTDERSNHHLAEAHLLSRVPIDPRRVHRMEAERADLDAAAAEYSQLLATTLQPGRSGAPRLDVILLGLGENGHTASLFPGDPSLDVVDAWATRSRADYEPYDRISMTFPIINGAASVSFLVTGASKREAFAAVIAGTVPAARVRPDDGELHWFIDQAAAATLP